MNLTDEQWAEILKQIIDCPYCGDGIPESGYPEHLMWCIPLIAKNKRLAKEKEEVKK